MIDWVSPRSAGRRKNCRLPYTRATAGVGPTDLEEVKTTSCSPRSRFIVPLTQRFSVPQRSLDYVFWRALVSEVPKLLTSSPRSTHVQELVARTNDAQWTCERILDAPGLNTDPACNLLAWSTHATLAVGLCSYAYCWLAGSGEVTSVYGPSSHPVRAIAWHHNGVCLAVSSSPSRIELVDANKSKVMRDISVNCGDINALTFSNDLLTVGGSAGSLLHIDVRMKHCAMSLETAHNGAINKVVWNSDSTRVGSAGQDSTVKIWELRQSGCICTLQADAVVRAMAWHPTHRGWLSYAGAHVMLYNHCTTSHLPLTSGLSQVAGLAWCGDGDHLMCASGTQVHLIESKTRSRSVVAVLDAQALQMAATEGQSLVTASSDETLRFWPVPSKYVTK